MTFPCSDRDRVSKLIARLGSDHTGEIVATVEALRRVLAAENLDFTDLAAELIANDDRHETPEEIVVPHDAEGWHKMVQVLLHQGLWANDWERKFLNDLLTWTGAGRRPSKKQARVLLDMSGRVPA